MAALAALSVPAARAHGAQSKEMASTQAKPKHVRFKTSTTLSKFRAVLIMGAFGAVYALSALRWSMN